MLESILVIAAFALFAALVTFILWRTLKRRQRARAWRTIADKHGLAYVASPEVKKGKAVWINLEGFIDAFQCAIALEFSEKLGLSAVARFKISPPLEPKSDRPTPPGSQGVTGDVDFDRRFVIPADVAVLDALSEEVRDDLLEATAGFDAVGAISPKTASLRIVSGLDSVEALDRLLDTAKVVAKIVADTRRTDAR